MIECHEIRPRIGAHVMGGLDPDEARELLEHLAACPSCAEVHRQLSHVVELIDLAGPEESLPPPAGLEDRLLARAGEASTPVQTARRRRQLGWLRPGLGGALVGALAVVALLAAFGVIGDSSPETKPSTAATVRLAPTAQAPGASAVVYVITKADGTTFALEARNLPVARPGERYEVWVSNKRGAYSAGALEVTRTGWSTAVLHSPRRAAPGSQIEISLVPIANEKGFRTLVQGTLPL